MPVNFLTLFALSHRDNILHTFTEHLHRMLSALKKLLPNKVKIFIKSVLKKKKSVSFLPSENLSECLCCGSNSLSETPVLWDSLISEWELSAAEAKYINHQQGFACQRCKARLRGMTLAYAIMRMNSYQGLFKDFVKTPWMRKKKILEINRADWLTQYFNQVPGHLLCTFPEVDIQNLPYAEATFDIVVHSDTLEHVPDPLQAMRECQRVLRRKGFCAFTVPVVIDRLTRLRAGLPPSFHGTENQTSEDYLVHTEFGADVWKLAFQAGFAEVRVFSLEYPAGLAFVFIK